MVTFLYRCPLTGYKVQAFVVDDLTDAGTDNGIFHTVTCSACTRVHVINPKTSKVLGDDEE
jgi:hypothetical protein